MILLYKRIFNIMRNKGGNNAEQPLMKIYISHNVSWNNKFEMVFNYHFNRDKLSNSWLQFEVTNSHYKTFLK